jgi:hypothetical protein
MSYRTKETKEQHLWKDIQKGRLECSTMHTTIEIIKGKDYI